MKKSNLIFLFFILIGLNNVSKSANCTATASGNWTNAAIWSCGHVPGCGDNIYIPAAFTINVNDHVNLDGCGIPNYIQVMGTLDFTNGKKINLACGSAVEIMPGGKMLPGSGGGSSNWLNICGDVLWQTSNGIVNGYKLFGTLNPLPVEFIAFQVEKNAGTHVFNWSVASERDNDFFTIDYSSDGYNWTELKKVNSVGDHIDGKTYNYSSDLNFSMNLNTYFRLSQTDINGEYVVLDVKALKNETQEISLFPNPAKFGENFIVALNSIEQQSTDVLVYNAQGQLVHNQSADLTVGVNHVTITPLNVNRGIYFVKIPSVSSVEIHRLIIE